MRGLLWAGVAACAEVPADVPAPVELPSWSPLDPARWAACPPDAAETWSGDPAWSGSLRAEFGAVYCPEGDADRSLEADLAARVLVMVPVGTWALPSDPGVHTMTLPVCVARVDGSGAWPGGEGAVEFTRAGLDARWVGEQPMEDPAGPRVFGWDIVTVVPPGEPPTAGLDGSDPDRLGFGGTFRYGPPEGGPATSVHLGACRAQEWPSRRLVVTVEGGAVEAQYRESPEGAVQLGHVRGRVGEVDLAVADALRLAARPCPDGGLCGFGAVWDGGGVRVDALDGAATAAKTDEGLAPLGVIRVVGVSGP